MTQKTAIEFSTPEALKKYLHDHPKADPHKHTVKKTEEAPGGASPTAPPPGEKPHGEEDHGGHDDHGHEEKPKKSWKEVVTSLSQKARSFVETAPASVKSFVTDDKHRGKVLMAAHASLVNAPAKVTQKLVATVKHEIHEFQEAGAGVKAVLGGKRPNKAQKHAMKTVAFHVGLTVAATALTASGLGAGAAMFAKSMARHVAMKAVGSMFEKLHILDELGHVGHGIGHVLDKLAAKKPKVSEGGEPDADLAMVQFVQALIADELKNMDAEDVGEAVEKNVRETQDVKTASVVADRFVAATLNAVADQFVCQVKELSGSETTNVVVATMKTDFQTTYLGFDLKFSAVLGESRYGGPQPRIEFQWDKKNLGSERAKKSLLHKIAAEVEEMTHANKGPWGVTVDHDGLNMETNDATAKQGQDAYKTLLAAIKKVVK